MFSKKEVQTLIYRIIKIAKQNLRVGWGEKRPNVIRMVIKTVKKVRVNLIDFDTQVLPPVDF